jgi:hypothetical protein
MWRNWCHVTGDAAFRNIEAELQEFAVDPRRPPTPILRRQASDQRPNLLADRRSAGTTSRSPAPVEAKAGAMPADHRLRLHDDQHVRPSRPRSLQGGPEKPVEAGQCRSRPLAFEYGNLLPEGEHLESGIDAAAEEHADGCQDREREIEHGSPLVTWRDHGTSSFKS